MAAHVGRFLRLLCCPKFQKILDILWRNAGRDSLVDGNNLGFRCKVLVRCVLEILAHGHILDILAWVVDLGLIEMTAMRTDGAVRALSSGYPLRVHI